MKVDKKAVKSYEEIRTAKLHLFMKIKNNKKSPQTYKYI